MTSSNSRQENSDQQILFFRRKYSPSLSFERMVTIALEDSIICQVAWSFSIHKNQEGLLTSEQSVSWDGFRFVYVETLPNVEQLNKNRI